MCLLRTIILLICVVLINSQAANPDDPTTAPPIKSSPDEHASASNVSTIYKNLQKYYSMCPAVGTTAGEVEEFCNSAYNNFLKSVKRINSICLRCSQDTVSDEKEKKICERVLNFNLEEQLREVCSKPSSGTKTVYLNYRKCCESYPDDVTKADEDCKDTISGDCSSSKYDCVKEKIPTDCKEGFLQNFLTDISCSKNEICKRYEENKDPNDEKTVTIVQEEQSTTNSGPTTVNSDLKPKATKNTQQHTTNNHITENDTSKSTGSDSTVSTTLQNAAITRKPSNFASKSYEFSTMAIPFVVTVLLRVFL